jgi:exodeoxyribonuclease-5
MLKNYLQAELLANFDFNPTPGQDLLLGELAEYIADSDPREVFLLKGYAGTGKTTIVNALVRTLTKFKFNTLLLAPTGRAAKVLSSYTSVNAYTIHKWIYRQKSSRDGLGKFVLDRNLLKNCFFIVDEASMIGDSNPDNQHFGSGDLLADLESFVYSGQNCRLILIGDTAQLPPVGLDISPALDPRHLNKLGLSVREFILTDVVRQSLDSGILANATHLRQLIAERTLVKPSIIVGRHSDVLRIEGSVFLEELENCYSRFGEEETIVINRSNKRANKYNQGIRNQVLWKEEEISTGDILMVVKNNYFWKDPENNPDFIANGDIVRIERILRYRDLYGKRFAEVRLSLPDLGNLSLDARIMLDVINLETAALSSADHREFYNQVLEDYADEGDAKKRSKKVLEDPYFNALQVKFAYAVTCHKAQGGQWKAVFIDQGYFNEDTLSLEYLRWLYTAFTRATEKIYLVNFPENFFSYPPPLQEK